ncbi:MAG TPA: carbonic anhydrase [Candidatus Dormibacteraeota bacterium]|nr:carbonic anhydrase [Candidatus Dormibacteraeota bacterium]
MPTPDDRDGLAPMLEANRRYAAEFDTIVASLPPSPRLAVLTCMDARIDPLPLLGLALGDAHVIRNAGALATDDAIRSLIISQRVLGTSEVLVVGHTSCGLLGFDEAAMRERLVGETATDAGLALLAFDDLAASVARQVDAIRRHPWTMDVLVRGLIVDVATGRLEPVG